MSSTRELRRNIKSIKSTRQITRAMEMVASSKLHRATQAAAGGKAYAERIAAIVKETVAGIDEPHPLLEVREVKKTLLLVMSSDRGLAGAYNSNIIKEALRIIRTSGHEVVVITLGKKAERALHRLGYTSVQSFSHAQTRPSFTDVLPIAASLAKFYAEGEVDRVLVLATRFHSLFRLEPTIRELLPLGVEAGKQPLPFLQEPSPEEMLDVIIPRYLAVSIYQDLQEALAAEHASRRMAMHNATDNASDLIDALQLTYNGVRQNSITREIAEITSGAASIGSTS